MGDWRLLALTSAISLVSSVIVAVVTAMLTSYFTHKNDTKKLIHEKRTELYYTFYDEVDKAISNRKVIFEKDYIMKIFENVPSIEDLREKTTLLYNAMREDLGSNL